MLMVLILFPNACQESGMKRISLMAAAMAACATLSLPDTARAVNPTTGGQGGSLAQPNVPTQPVSPYSPSNLPGTGYNFGGLGGVNDPFFNPNLYNTTPTYPGYNPSQGNQPGTAPMVPNPAPSTYPDSGNRTRLTSPVQPGYMPPGQIPSSNQKKWRLGVYSKDTDTGVRIHDVVAGAAAARAGLEVNDTIVAVNGYQVGYVNGQLFDCGTEFDRLADQNGWVTLLVQNNRDSQLMMIPVQLDSRLSTLKGSIALQNRQNLPANAIVNVELKEMIGNNSNPVTFASTQIDTINQYPIPFSIDFDPAHISQNGRYAVYASVLVNGREIMRTPQPIRVLEQPGGQMRQVALQLDQIQQQPNQPQPTTPVGMGQDAQIAQIVKWFNQYLGRDPSDRELVTWLEQLRQGQSIAQVQLALLANEQFFNRCDADKRVYIQRMHELLVGREPNQAEMNYWLARYDATGGIRMDVAKEFQGALGIH
jgi:uncharacterized lipoprotein YbaY